VKVYVIEEGCKYEGTGIVAIYALESSALLACDHIIANHRMRKYTRGVVDAVSFAAGLRHVWEDESDILYISEHEVIQ